jgi:hypothetical protein
MGRRRISAQSRTQPPKTNRTHAVPSVGAQKGWNEMLRGWWHFKKRRSHNRENTVFNYRGTKRNERDEKRLLAFQKANGR